MSEQEQQKPQQGTTGHLVGAGITTLFPTPLISGQLQDMTLCDRLEKVILKMRDEKLGNFEAGNFVTNDQLHLMENYPDIEEFSNLALAESANFLDFLRVKRDTHYITNMWANVTNPNHRHPVHMHPNCLVSGLLYIKTPEDCGGTAFVDPRPAARVFEPSYEQMFEYNAGLFRYPAKKGTLLLWPAWLYHGVDRGFTKDENEDRISIAFNVMMLGKIDTPTAKLELN
jgi:uncharacterized protein (TIGR02466 family)